MALQRLIGTAAQLVSRLPGCAKLRRFEADLAHYGVKNAWRRTFPKKKTPQDVLHTICLVQMNELRQKKKALMIGTSEHRNIGDAAITLAQQRLLSKQYPEYFQVEFSTYELEDRYDFLHGIIHPDDIFFLNGGGNLGSSYPAEEAMHRRIIADFPDHKVIILPQTIHFADTEAGRCELALSEEVYNRHPDLTLFTRGKESLEFAKEHFPNANAYLMADVVFSLERDWRLPRSGALACLRVDDEGWLTPENKALILQTISKYADETEQITNITPEDVKRDRRAAAVYAELKRYASRRFVVTDRLHGLIFAAVTHTPVVVIRSANQKLEEFYRQFLADSNAVFYIGTDLSQLDEAIRKAAAVTEPVYPIFEANLLQSIRALAERKSA